VANASITGYVTQSSDILSNLSSKLAPHDVIAVDDLRYPAKLVFGEFTGFCAFFDQ